MATNHDCPGWQEELRRNPTIALSGILAIKKRYDINKRLTPQEIEELKELQRREQWRCEQTPPQNSGPLPHNPQPFFGPARSQSLVLFVNPDLLHHPAPRVGIANPQPQAGIANPQPQASIVNPQSQDSLVTPAEPHPADDPLEYFDVDPGYHLAASLANSNTNVPGSPFLPPSAVEREHQRREIQIWQRRHPTFLGPLIKSVSRFRDTLLNRPASPTLQRQMERIWVAPQDSLLQTPQQRAKDDSSASLYTYDETYELGVPSMFPPEPFFADVAVHTIPWEGDVERAVLFYVERVGYAFTVAVSPEIMCNQMHNFAGKMTWAINKARRLSYPVGKRLNEISAQWGRRAARNALVTALRERREQVKAIPCSFAAAYIMTMNFVHGQFARDYGIRWNRFVFAHSITLAKDIATRIAREQLYREQQERNGSSNSASSYA